ncbi:HlyD family secretion protein [Paracoccus jiaweipingae]|uniref:HlyD family secretion protein n=1 Tax=unclassified Paracoccus (in: a-proteobacteria) TaxID=2688777 RepID=UPI003793C622
MSENRKKLVWGAALVVLALAGWMAWRMLGTGGTPAGFAAGNGRIEATEIDIAALMAGRIADIPVQEGQFVARGAVLAQMDVVQLNAQKRQAEAALERAQIGVQTAQALVRQAQAQQTAADAQVRQAQAVKTNTDKRLARSESLVRSNTVSQQVLDNDRANALEAEAGLGAAQAQLAAAEAGVSAAQAQVVDAQAQVVAAQAAIDSVTKSIEDSTLTAPRDGRVQYLVAQPGEVVGAGGRVVNMVDLTDVYMTFFLPTSQAGRVRLGDEVRLVMDAAPDLVVPAMVSYVADVAQFTPKTVETADEREKLMFRIRARVAPQLLRAHLDVVKTGVPGMAWLRLDPQADWPAHLQNPVQ